MLYIFDKPDPLFHLPFGKGLVRLNSMEIFSMLPVRISLVLQRNRQEKKEYCYPMIKMVVAYICGRADIYNLLDGNVFVVVVWSVLWQHTQCVAQAVL